MELSQIRIGASEVAPALGLSPYETPLEWWARKVGLLDRDEGNEATVLGQYLEDGLGRLFAVQHHVELTKGGDYRHPSIGWMAATPDFLVPWDGMSAGFKQLCGAREPGEVVLLEIKTTGLATWRPAVDVAREWGEEGTSHVPVSYAAQVQQQIAVVDAALRDLDIGFCRRAFVKALIPGRGSPEFVVDADRDVARFIASGLQHIVDAHLLPEVPPKPQSAEDWGVLEDVVARPWKEKKRRPATPEEEALVVAWRAARARHDDNKVELARLRTELIEKLGDTYGLDLGFGSISYTGGTESPRLRKAAALEEVIEWTRNGAPPEAAAAIGAIIAKNTKTSKSGRQLRPRFNDEEGKAE